MTHEEQRPTRSTWFCLAVLVVGSIIVVMTGGCAMYNDYSHFTPAANTPGTPPDAYRMATPDEILVRSENLPMIDGHRENIGPDGRINLPLLGSIYVAGKTSEELSRELEQQANAFHGDARVHVRVVSYRSQRVYVFGEVARPGPYHYDGTNTLLGTLALAQPTRLADPCRIHVMRPTQTGELVSRMTINLDNMVKRGDMRRNVVLEEGDILYVPANPVASVGLVVQQLFLPFMPSSAKVHPPQGTYHTQP